jgi:uncharacterized protein YegP (UPF0339 family)
MRADNPCLTTNLYRIQHMGKIQIKKQMNNQFRFIMKAGNGQTILTSEAYRTKEACLNGIESLRKNAVDPKRYEFKKSFNQKHYFNVTDARGEIIGSSEVYESSSGRDVGIGLVKVSATNAVIEDLA